MTDLVPAFCRAAPIGFLAAFRVSYELRDGNTIIPTDSILLSYTNQANVFRYILGFDEHEHALIDINSEFLTTAIPHNALTFINYYKPTPWTLT